MEIKLPVNEIKFVVYLHTFMRANRKYETFENIKQYEYARISEFRPLPKVGVESLETPVVEAPELVEIVDQGDSAVSNFQAVLAGLLEQNSKKSSESGVSDDQPTKTYGGAEVQNGETSHFVTSSIESDVKSEKSFTDTFGKSLSDETSGGDTTESVENAVAPATSPLMSMFSNLVKDDTESDEVEDYDDFDDTESFNDLDDDLDSDIDSDIDDISDDDDDYDDDDFEYYEDEVEDVDDDFNDDSDYDADEEFGVDENEFETSSETLDSSEDDIDDFDDDLDENYQSMGSSESLQGSESDVSSEYLDTGLDIFDIQNIFIASDYSTSKVEFKTSTRVKPVAKPKVKPAKPKKTVQERLKTEEPVAPTYYQNARVSNVTAGFASEKDSRRREHEDFLSYMRRMIRVSESVALEYFSPREVDSAVKEGRVMRKSGILVFSF